MTKQHKLWIDAMRLYSLPLAVASILLGAALAKHQGLFDIWTFILALVTACLLQITANLANDYGDFVHGVDKDSRVCADEQPVPGKITLSQIKKSVVIFALLSAIFGLLLLTLSLDKLQHWLFFAVLGIAATIAAIRYTMGPKPYGYRGMGDLNVFIYFGMVGVAGSFFLQTRAFVPEVVFPAISCGLLAVAVLNINNIRDIQNDALCGKVTLAVLLGPKRARIYHQLLILIAFSCYLIFLITRTNSWWPWAGLGLFPVFIRISYLVQRSSDADTLSKQLESTAQFSFLFSLLISAGLWIESLPAG